MTGGEDARRDARRSGRDPMPDSDRRGELPREEDAIEEETSAVLSDL